MGILFNGFFHSMNNIGNNFGFIGKLSAVKNIKVTKNKVFKLIIIVILHPMLACAETSDVSCSVTSKPDIVERGFEEWTMNWPIDENDCNMKPESKVMDSNCDTLSTPYCLPCTTQNNKNPIALNTGEDDSDDFTDFGFGNT